MRTLAIGLLTAGLTALTFSGPAFGTEFPIAGGKGGGFFRVFCPPGNFMVGLQGRAGDVIDHMHVICAGVTPRRAIPPRRDWTRDPNVFPVGNFIGTSNGGADDNQVCGGFNLVKGIRFNTRFFDGLHLVAWVNMTCNHARFAGAQDLTFGSGLPPGSSPATQVCPAREWAIGLKGRFGDRVDAIGLLCAPMPSVRR